MRNFRCRCGTRVFFENTRCTSCGSTLGYDPGSARLLALDPGEGKHWLDPDGRHWRLCGNYVEFAVCNWLVPAEDAENYCLACGLNEVIPSLKAPENRDFWANMEVAKRRLVYSLLALGLPLVSRHRDPERGLAFAFLEDRRRNPAVREEFVGTGHAQGLITVNLAEADDASREQTRQSLGESYRTLLGHFRHESGHYYFDRLVVDRGCLEEFRAVFGDERADYDEALARYYSGDRRANWQQSYISAYAQAHPIEDWAECWAHYLHMTDTLETAACFDMLGGRGLPETFDDKLSEWMRLTVALNALNRSMGLADAYPFVLNETCVTKLRFVHRRVSDPTRTPRQSAEAV